MGEVLLSPPEVYSQAGRGGPIVITSKVRKAESGRYWKVLCCWLFKNLFYLFGCTGSWLQHVGSSVFCAACEVFS